MSMSRRSQLLLFSVVFVIGLVTLFGGEANAFQTIPVSQTGRRTGDVRQNGRNLGSWVARGNRLFALPEDKESDSVQKLFDYDNSNFDTDIDDDDLEEIETGQPPEWMVMQQVNK